MQPTISAPPDAAVVVPGGADFALAEGESVITLPPGLSLEDLGQNPEDISPPANEGPAPGQPAATVQVSPTVAEPEPAPAEPRKGPNPNAALRRLNDEVRKLKRENQQLRQQPPPALPALSEEDWKTLGDPRGPVETAGTMTAGLRAVWDYASQKAQTERQTTARVTSEQERVQALIQRAARSQEAFTKTHPDFETRITSSGAFDEFREGGPFWQQIVSAEDPAAAIYAVATERLRDMGMLDDEGPTAPPVPIAPAVVPQPVRQPAAAPRHVVQVPASDGRNGAAPVPAAVALSPAAARVVEEMARTPAPPRGIRSVPSAGGPARAVLTDADLDRLRETNPERYVDLLNANPDLMRRRMGGG